VRGYNEFIMKIFYDERLKKVFKVDRIAMMKTMVISLAAFSFLLQVKTVLASLNLN
jgi:hypothetical protein